MSAPDLRVGLGVDLHPWGRGRQLLLGGVLFDGVGLAGHSDGDVVCHAVADALLGAAGLGDLGMHFPDTDPAFEGIGGLELLGRVTALLEEGAFVAEQVDLTVLAERPAIGPRRDAVRSRLAEVLAVDVKRISVKATRPEGLGLTGEGIGCLAVALVTRRAAG